MIYQMIKESLICRFSKKCKEVINRLLSKAYLFIKASDVLCQPILDASLVPYAPYQRDCMLIPNCSHNGDYCKDNRCQKQNRRDYAACKIAEHRTDCE